MIFDCERCTAERCAECVDGSGWVEYRLVGFDLANGPDVTAITRNGTTEYILNPNWSKEAT